MQETETVLSVIREPITRKVITGEPVMGKPIRRVREGADGKGSVLRAPRRRPTSLGGRLHGKGPHPHGIRDLAVQPTLPWSRGRADLRLETEHALQRSLHRRVVGFDPWHIA